MIKNPSLPALYEQIAALLKPAQVYLVGGAVRDLLLKKPIHDLDFTLLKNTIPAAKKVADQWGGAFYVLDQERETARVILKDEKGQRMMVDFTRFQGSSIEEDLQSRDFTITSMAIDINNGTDIIDFHHGAQDLKDGVLRSTTDHALRDDPLRCLRAVRLAAQYGLRIMPETKSQIHQYKSLLDEVSPERIRDELFRILEGPKQTAALGSLNILGLSKYIFKEDLSPYQTKTLRNLENIWGLFLKKHDQYSAANWSLGLLVHRLGRFREQIQEHLAQEIVPGRSIYQLAFLAPLTGSQTEEGSIASSSSGLSGNFPLSNQERDYLGKSIKAANEIRELSDSDKESIPLMAFRYYRQAGSAGVIGVFLALAAHLVDNGNQSHQDQWIVQLDTARNLLEGWWEKQDSWINPPVLLDGNDLQNEFGVQPGPRLGQILESLREAQVMEGFRSRDEAGSYLDKLLRNSTGSKI